MNNNRAILFQIWQKHEIRKLFGKFIPILICRKGNIINWKKKKKKKKKKSSNRLQTFFISFKHNTSSVRQRHGSKFAIQFLKKLIKMSASSTQAKEIGWTESEGTEKTSIEKSFLSQQEHHNKHTYVPNCRQALLGLPTKFLFASASFDCWQFEPNLLLFYVLLTVLMSLICCC